MKKISERGVGAAALLVVASVIVVIGVVVYAQLRTNDSLPQVPSYPSITPVVVQKPVVTPVSVPASSSQAPVVYTGQVLAGGQATLLDFTKADYDKALASENLIVLYFYANWCPICQAEFPVMQSAFHELSSGNVIGFRVNFNDNQTDEFEKALAREHGVAYQHTKVLVKNGQRVLKSPETWTKDEYLSHMTSGQ